MISRLPISQVVTILRKEVLRFTTPIVTKISRKKRCPFLVLISCILSLRTKDAVTAAASRRLFKLAATPQRMLRLSQRAIEKTIYPAGFYRVKARHILNISDAIIRSFNGKVPDKLEELLTLKGVGRKTANLVLTEGFNKLGVCVDTHVHRISNRLGYIKTRTPLETEMVLRKKLPKPFWKEYNTLLVTWGQNICKPISPLCSVCAIKRYCRRVGVRICR
ncbi:MAG: endonuclease III domain-containing protein [Candidatus Omnitrophota bacterium]